MKRLNRKTTKIVAAILVLVMMASVVSLAVFTDRQSAKMQFTTATFHADGYTLKREAPVGPFIAGENVSVTLWETNTKDEDVNSVITMTVGWNSPDPNSKIFGNPNSADNATVKISGDGLNGSISIDYTVNKDGTITFDLPKHLLSKQSSDSERHLTFHIPESLTATGSLDFTFDKVILSQVPGGFTAEYTAADLNAATKLNFSVDVGWAASANTANNGKNLMAYLTSDGKGIEFKHAFGSSRNPMKDFSSPSDARWSNYNDVIKNLIFVEGMTTIGDYAFADFTGITSVSFPSTITGIGISAFDGSGLTREVTIPANVTTLEERAFGNLPKVTIFTFEHDVDDVLILPNNEESGKTSSGVFHVGSPYSQNSPLGTKVNTNNNKYVLGYDWSIDARGYTVTVETVTGVTVTAAPITAINGQSIDLTSEAAAGYEYNGSHVKWTENGTPKTLNLSKDALSFTMPASNVTVTPIASPITYNIKYEVNGGDLSSDVPKTFTVETESFDLPIPSRPGYNFDGWYTKSDLSGEEVTELPKGSIGDKTFYAKWEPITYHIKYNANGGSGTMETSTHTFDVEKKLSKNTFTKDDYEFLGWATSPDGDVVYSDEDMVKNLTYTDGATINLYAKWKLVVKPMLATQNSWQYVKNADGSYTKALEDEIRYELTTINIVDTYEPDGTEYKSWDASAYETVDGVDYMGTVTAYISQDQKTLILAGNGTGNIFAHPDSSRTFASFPKVTAINGADKLDMSTATDTSSMFSDDYQLTTLDVSNWDTRNVTNMVQMFYICYELQSLNVSGWDTGNVENMSYMFNDCTALSELTGIRNWDTQKVWNMRRMFLGCNSLPSLDLSSKSVTLNGRTYDSWDTGEVTDMSYMFGASEEEDHVMESLNVSTFDMSKVTDMQAMFQGCKALKSLNVTPTQVTLNNDTLHSWDVVNVQKMNLAFKNCSSLTTLDLSAWDTSGVGTGDNYTVDDFSEMFYGCTSLETLDVARKAVTGINGRNYTSWNTSNAVYMSSMFANCSSLKSLDLKNWNNAVATNMDGMFSGCSSITAINLTNFTTAACNTMSTMFYGCSSLPSVNVSNFDTNNVNYMYNMFSKCSSLKKLDISNFNTSNVKSGRLDKFAQYCTSLTEIVLGSNFAQSSNCPAAGSSTGMFYVGDPYSTTNLLGTKITDANSTMLSYNWRSDFRGFTITVNTLTGGSLTADADVSINGKTITLIANANSGYAYDGATVKYTESGSAKTITLDENSLTFTMPAANVTIIPKWDNAVEPILAKWNVLGVMGYTDFNGVEWDEYNQPIDKGHTDFHQYKRDVTEIEIMTSYNLPNDFDTSAGYDGPWDVSDKQDGSVMSYVVKNGTYENYDGEIVPTYKVYICNNQEVTKKVQKVIANPISSYVFNNFNSLLDFKGGANLDMSRATTVDRMFWDCYVLETLDVSNWNMSKVTSAWEMFCYSGQSFDLDVSNWDVSSLKNAKGMFRYTGVNALDVSDWNTKSLEDASEMFIGNWNLTELDVSKWNTSNVTTLEGTFNALNVSTLDVARKTVNAGTANEYVAWDTSKVTNTADTFAYCESIKTLDVSGWKMNLVEDASSMFTRCTLLENLDVSRWETTSLIDAYGMFQNCAALKSIDVSNWDTSTVDDFRYMFQRCSALTKLDLSSFTFESIQAPGTWNNYLNGFAVYCPSLTEITFGDGWNTVELPDAGDSDGLFYVTDPYTASSPLGTNVITDSPNILNYDWAADHRGFTITVTNVTGGTLIVNQNTAINGKTVSLTANASNGYSYEGATVSYAESGAVKNVDLGTSTTTFSMPAADVTITPKWKDSLITQAIYTADNGYLTFIRDTKLYTTADTYNDNAITAVYTGFDTSTTSSQPWSTYAQKITNVLVVDEISALNTGSWFKNFKNCSSFDLTKLDVSSVTNMYQMFYYAGSNVSDFSIIGLDTWDVSSVTNMNGMFNYAGNKASTWSIGDLSEWDTSSVTYMGSLFAEAGGSATTWSVGDLSEWDTSSVRNMYGTFDYAGNKATTWFAGDLSEWDTSSVTSMAFMFRNAGHSATTWSVGNLSGWDTSSVTNMWSMFKGAGSVATTWSLDLSGWDTSSVTDMSSMFDGAGSRATIWSVGDLSEWDTSSVTDMNRMFNDAGGYGNATTWFTGDLSEWDTSSVTDMSYMFYSVGDKDTNWSIGDLSGWDTSSVTNMNSMFRLAGRSATTWSLDLSEWDTSSVTDMSGMFEGAGYSATTWSVGDLSGWDTSSVTNMHSMFGSAGYSAATWSVGDLSGWDTSSVTDMGTMFNQAGSNATTWSLNGLSDWDTSSVTDMSSMFNQAGRYSTNWSLDLFGWDTSAVTNMSNMFANAGQGATTWSLNGLSGWDTSAVTNMSGMFSSAGFNATYTLDLSGWNVANVTSYSRFNTNVTTKVIAPSFGTTAASLSMTSDIELPADVTAGEALSITAMPNVAELNTQSEANASENTVLYGYLVDNGMAQEIVLLGDFEATLHSVYDEVPDSEMTITPLYQIVQHSGFEDPVDDAEPTDEEGSEDDDSSSPDSYQDTGSEEPADDAEPTSTSAETEVEEAAVNSEEPSSEEPTEEHTSEKNNQSSETLVEEIGSSFDALDETSIEED